MHIDEILAAWIRRAHIETRIRAVAGAKYHRFRGRDDGRPFFGHDVQALMRARARAARITEILCQVIDDNTEQDRDRE